MQLYANVWAPVWKWQLLLWKSERSKYNPCSKKNIKQQGFLQMLLLWNFLSYKTDKSVTVIVFGHPTESALSNAPSTNTRFQMIFSFLYLIWLIFIVDLCFFHPVSLADQWWNGADQSSCMSFESDEALVGLSAQWTCGFILKCSWSSRPHLDFHS